MQFFTTHDLHDLPFLLSAGQVFLYIVIDHVSAHIWSNFPIL